MTVMRWNNRFGFIGYTQRAEEHGEQSRSLRRCLQRLVYDVTDYIQFRQAFMHFRTTGATGY